MNRLHDASGKFSGTGKCKNPEYVRAYEIERRKSIKTKFTYLKAGTCPRCGKHGYFYLNQKRNIKTNVTFRNPSLEVRHTHQEQGHTIYDGYCYIETVKAV